MMPPQRRRERPAWVQVTAMGIAANLGALASWAAAEALMWLAAHWLTIAALLAVTVLLAVVVSSGRRRRRR